MEKSLSWSSSLSDSWRLTCESFGFFQRNSTFTASAVFQGMLSVHSQISLCKAHSISKQPLSSGQSSLRVINSNKRKLVQSTAFDSHQCSTHSFSVSAKMDVENSPPPSDRCAIITGVARSTGIGRILVHHFLKNVSKLLEQPTTFDITLDALKLQSYTNRFSVFCSFERKERFLIPE